MTTLREAAQQALFALQYHVEMTWPVDRTTAAITALRAALAEQQEPEPVAWLVDIGSSKPRQMHFFSKVHAEEFAATLTPPRVLTPLYTAPPQRKENSNE